MRKRVYLFRFFIRNFLRKRRLQSILRVSEINANINMRKSFAPEEDTSQLTTSHAVNVLAFILWKGLAGSNFREPVD